MKRNVSFINIAVTIITVLVLIGGLGAAPSQPQNLQSVIVQSSTAEQAAMLVEYYGGTVTSDLSIINGVGAQVTPGALAVMKSDSRIVRISSNAETRLSGEVFDRAKRTPSADYPEAVGADLVWEEHTTGKGIGVAVLDTGIALHPALMKDINGRPRRPVVGWKDYVDGWKVPVDPNGHGTHIAGIIANGSKGKDGGYNGIAPGVNLIGVRVLDYTGAGDYEKVIQGIQWTIKNKNRYNIKVMNLSLHALVQSPYWADPLNQAVMKAWAAGITVVVAAGNNGPDPMSISVPGNNPYVITVGAFTDNYTPNDWRDDYLAEFSSAGPTLDGFVKPDILAPGAHMVSTMMPGSYVARKHEANWVDGLYFSMAGTSQAAAVVSGIAALVLDKNETLTPDQVKYRVLITSLPWIKEDQSDVLYSVWQQGAGRVNAVDAVNAPDIEGSANSGMDIQADLDGSKHYEGYSYYDEEAKMFRLHGFETATGGFGAWSGGYGAWSGGFGAWSGGFGAWSGGFGAWSGGFGAWSGGFGAWSGGFGAWSGGFGAWSGGYGAWSGGYGAWSGGYGAWSGGYGAWSGSTYYEPDFMQRFKDGVSPEMDTSTETQRWVEEK